MWEWILSKLKEPGTWKGIIGILGAVGITVTPEQADNIIAGILAIIGMINVGKKG